MIYIVKSKKILALVLSILLSTFLFGKILINYSNNNLLNPDYHMNAYEENDIYDNVYEAFSNYLGQLSTNEDDNVKKMIYLYIKKSFTREVIEYNVNNFTEELFEYFNGKRPDLPDIYLNADSNTQENSSLFENLTNLADLDKISINEALVYADKTEMIDYFDRLKKFYNISNNLSEIFLVSIILLFIIGILMFISSNNIIYLLKLVFAQTSILLISIFILIKVASNEFLNVLYQRYDLENSNSEFIIGYINYILKDFEEYVFIFGVVFLILTFLFTLLNIYLKRDFVVIPFKLIKKVRLRKKVQIVSIIIFIFILAVFLVLSIESIKTMI